jgi:hypothetical protein
MGEPPLSAVLNEISTDVVVIFTAERVVGAEGVVAGVADVDVDNTEDPIALRALTENV